MKQTKRGFLKLLSGAAFGGKKVVETAAAEAVKLAGVDGSGFGYAHSPFIGGSVGPILANEGPVNAREAVWKQMLRSGSLPSWKVNEIKEETDRVYSLDPDLATFRSFSLAAKVHIQRQRQYDRAIASARKRLDLDDLREAFLKKHGFDWF